MGIVLGKVTVETPSHAVVRAAADGAYEIRQYGSSVAAEVRSADWAAGMSEREFSKVAFPTLARYIGVFGDGENVARGGGADADADADAAGKGGAAAGEEGANNDDEEEEEEEEPDTEVADALAAAAARERDVAAGDGPDAFGRWKAVAAEEGLHDMADWFQQSADASARLAKLLDAAADAEAKAVDGAADAE